MGLVGVGRAYGGAINGPGTGTSDSIPAMLSNGEHVWTAAEVAKADGQGAMYAMSAAVRSGTWRAYADGGAVGVGKSAGPAPVTNNYTFNGQYAMSADEIARSLERERRWAYALAGVL